VRKLIGLTPLDLWGARVIHRRSRDGRVPEGSGAVIERAKSESGGALGMVMS